MSRFNFKSFGNVLEKGILRPRLLSAAAPQEPKIWVNIVLFLTTVFTTTTAGAMLEGVDFTQDLNGLLKGVPFSATILLILGAHEFGHYFMARKWGVKVTLPYFIPFPSIIGTMGAVIKIRSRIQSKKALFDIGIAGPLAGFVLALIAFYIGLTLSHVMDQKDTETGIVFGESFLIHWMGVLIWGDAEQQIYLHPIGFAGWVGLLVTMLNLLPMGQLDGGHILYSLFGNKQTFIAKLTWVVLVGLSYFFPAYLIWVIFGMVMGLRHPAIIEDYEELDQKRKILGYVTMIIFILIFMPVPIRIPGA